MQDGDELITLIMYNLWYLKNKEKDPNLKYDPKEWGIKLIDDDI